MNAVSVLRSLGFRICRRISSAFALFTTLRTFFCKTADIWRNDVSRFFSSTTSAFFKLMMFTSMSFSSSRNFCRASSRMLVAESSACEFAVTSLSTVLIASSSSLDFAVRDLGADF